MIKNWFSASELVDLDLPAMPSTQQGVKLRATKEDWDSRPRSAVGGGTEYQILSLPVPAREELARRHLQQFNPTAAGAIPEGQRATAQAGLNRLASTNGHAFERATAKLELLAVFNEWQKLTGIPLKSARTAFAALWNARQIPAPTELYAAIPQTSDSTLRRDQQNLKKDGAARLGGNQGKHRKGAGTIDSDETLQAVIVGLLQAGFNSKNIMRSLRARADEFEKLPAYRSLQRWIGDYQNANKALVSAMKDPDEFRNKYRVAAGSTSEEVLRLNQRWELDSTPTDVMLADGRRHAIVGAIDVYSRRVKFLVTRTSNSNAISSLIRKCMIDWGVPEQVKTDNGSDYVSKQTKAVFEGLRIEHILCPPGSPERKPHIERVFRTVLHSLFEILPAFIGHNVAERKAIEARGRHLEPAIALEALTPEELQEICDQWLANVYEHEAHGGLNGRTPFEVAAASPDKLHRIEDERALDMLLMPIASGGGLRTVTKKGIAAENTHFLAPELGLHVGRQVKVFLDEADAAAIYVRAESGEFICKAFAPERAGLSRPEINAQMKAVQAAYVKEHRAASKRKAPVAREDRAVRDILEAEARKAGKLANFPKQAETYTTPALEQAALATRAGEPPKPEPLTPERAARQAEIARELEQPKVVQLPETAKQRYTRAYRLQLDIDAGRPVDAAAAKWLGGYEQTPEYRAQKLMHENFGAEYGINEGASEYVEA